MKTSDLLRHHVYEVSDRLTSKFAPEGADTYNRTREEVVKPQNSKSIVVLRMQSEIVADGDTHANFNVTFHGLGVVQSEHHIRQQSLGLEGLLHPLPQLAFRRREN